MPTIAQSVSLYYRQGSSDKVYNLSIEQSGGQYRVVGEYGRRGGTLKTHNKTGWVSWGTAITAYDEVLDEKTGKGYRRASDTPRPARYTTPTPAPRPKPKIVLEIPEEPKPEIKKSFIDVDEEL